MFNRLLVVPVVLVVLIALPGTGSGALANKINPQVASLYVALIEATRQADGALFEQMEGAISSLKDLSETRGRFPSRKEDLSEAVGRLSQSLGENPYEPPVPPPEPVSPTVGGLALSNNDSGWSLMNPDIGGLVLGPSELSAPPYAIGLEEEILHRSELASPPAANGSGGQVLGPGEFGSRPLPLSETRLTPSSQSRIQVLVDAGLDEAALENLQDSPPKDWEGNPGSIVILSNGRDLILAWGAGSNRKPIVDEDSGKVRFAITRFKLN